MTTPASPHRVASPPTLTQGAKQLASSGRRPAALARDPERVYAGELREHRPAMGGAVEGVAGGEHQLVVIDRLQDLDVLRIDDLVPGDLVGERRVGHLQADLVAVLDLIYVAEGGEVGGAVAGDRHRPRLSRERGLQVVAGPVLEGGGVGSLEEDHVDVDPVDLYPADRIALLDPSLEAVGEDPSSLGVP